MRRLKIVSITRVAVLAAALAAHVWAGESPTGRAAEAGLSPDFCPTLRALVDAAGSSFAALRGPTRPGSENMWEGTKRLPGGGECSVFGGTPAAYVCIRYAGDAEDNADGAYGRAVSALKDCLPDGWKTTEKVDGVHARTTVASGTSGPTVRVVSRDVSGDAYLVELWVDAARR